MNYFLIKKERLIDLATNPKFLLPLWIVLGVVASFKQFLISQSGGSCYYNNFKIFSYSFEHLLHHKSLYSYYPQQYFDLYYYGPLFALLMAPFYYLPSGIALVLWSVLNAWCLFQAIWLLPLKSSAKAIIIWISTNNLITTTLNSQFNALCVAMIIFSYVYTFHKKERWATLFIVLGAFTKLYGIVGATFLAFSRSKKKFVWWLFIWTVLIFLLPMVLFGPSYILGCYREWYITLIGKNAANMNIDQIQLDVCVMGMVRKITRNPNLSNLYYIIPALMIMGISAVRFRLHRQLNFQLASLASLIMFIVLASTGSESPTYIIAFPGVGIWYVLEKKKTLLVIVLLGLTLLISSFSPTDFFPRSIRVNYLQPYALMAFPIFLVWLRLNYLMITNRLKPMGNWT